MHRAGASDDIDCRCPYARAGHRQHRIEGASLTELGRKPLLAMNGAGMLGSPACKRALTADRNGRRTGVFLQNRRFTRGEVRCCDSAPLPTEFRERLVRQCERLALTLGT